MHLFGESDGDTAHDLTMTVDAVADCVLPEFFDAQFFGSWTQRGPIEQTAPSASAGPSVTPSYSQPRQMPRFRYGAA